MTKLILFAAIALAVQTAKPVPPKPEPQKPPTATTPAAAAAKPTPEPPPDQWPMWGGTPDRNMVSSMKGIPTTWDLKAK
jgi:cell division septation protein DedD